MKRYRFELILGAVFLAVVLAYCYFVSSGPKLTPEEVAEFVATIDQDLQMPEPTRTEFLARVKAWGEADDGGPVYLANIFHANDARRCRRRCGPGSTSSRRRMARKPTRSTSRRSSR
jgi:hypothetical protein